MFWHFQSCLLRGHGTFLICFSWEENSAWARTHTENALVTSFFVHSDPPETSGTPVRWVSGPPPYSPPPSSVMFTALQTHLILYKGKLAESFHASAQPSLLFICCCAEPLWPDSHMLAVKGKVFFFDGIVAGGSLISCDPSQAFLPQLHCFIMTWTPPRSLQTTLAPSKYHICHLCLNPQSWIMFECELESERRWNPE